MSVTFSGTPQFCSALHIASRKIVSNARSKSTKRRYSGDLHLLECSMIIRKVLMWSTQDRFGLKPFCSLRNCALSVGDILASIMNARTLWIVLSNVMPRQFLHWLRSPFFGIVIIIPSFHSPGIVEPVHADCIIGCRARAVTFAPYLRSSDGRSSGPGDLLFFNLVIASRISSYDGGSVEIFLLGFLLCVVRELDATSSPGELSLKNSSHRFSWSSSEVKMVPFSALLGGTLSFEFVSFLMACKRRVGYCCLLLFLLRLL